MTLRNCISILISLISMTSLPSYAVDFHTTTNLETMPGPSEYVIQDRPDQKLITVHLLSGVLKPGLYRIPAETNMVTLISYSGGFSENANTDKINLKTETVKETRKMKLEDLMVNGTGPIMSNNDVLYVKARSPLIDRDTMLTVALISGILGIIVLTLSISNQTKGR